MICFWFIVYRRQIFSIEEDKALQQKAIINSVLSSKQVKDNFEMLQKCDWSQHKYSVTVDFKNTNFKKLFAIKDGWTPIVYRFHITWFKFGHKIRTGSKIVLKKKRSKPTPSVASSFIYVYNPININIFTFKWICK